VTEVCEAVQGVQGRLRDICNVVTQHTKHKPNLYRRRELPDIAQEAVIEVLYELVLDFVLLKQVLQNPQVATDDGLSTGLSHQLSAKALKLARVCSETLQRKGSSQLASDLRPQINFQIPAENDVYPHLLMRVRTTLAPALHQHQVAYFIHQLSCMLAAVSKCADMTPLLANGSVV